MADSLSSPWLETYLVDTAETYGALLIDVPLYEKKKKVQLIEFLTFQQSNEDDCIWAKISDKLHKIPVRFTKEAIAEYNHLYDGGRRITEHKNAIIVIKDFRPFFARVPVGRQVRKMTELPHLALDVRHISVLGSDEEPVFGEPRDVEAHPDLREWADGLRHDGGGGNILKLRREAAHKLGNGSPTTTVAEQRRLPSPKSPVKCSHQVSKERPRIGIKSPSIAPNKASTDLVKEELRSWRRISKAPIMFARPHDAREPPDTPDGESCDDKPIVAVEPERHNPPRKSPVRNRPRRHALDLDSSPPPITPEFERPSTPSPSEWPLSQPASDIVLQLSREDEMDQRSDVAENEGNADIEELVDEISQVAEEVKGSEESRIDKDKKTISEAENRNEAQHPRSPEGCLPPTTPHAPEIPIPSRSQTPFSSELPAPTPAQRPNPAPLPSPPPLPPSSPPLLTQAPSPFLGAHIPSSPVRKHDPSPSLDARPPSPHPPYSSMRLPPSSLASLPSSPHLPPTFPLPSSSPHHPLTLSPLPPRRNVHRKVPYPTHILPPDPGPAKILVPNSDTSGASQAQSQSQSQSQSHSHSQGQSQKENETSAGDDYVAITSTPAPKGRTKKGLMLPPPSSLALSHPESYDGDRSRSSPDRYAALDVDPTSQDIREASTFANPSLSLINREQAEVEPRSDTEDEDGNENGEEIDQLLSQSQAGLALSDKRRQPAEESLSFVPDSQSALALSTQRDVVQGSHKGQLDVDDAQSHAILSATLPASIVTQNRENTPLLSPLATPRAALVAPTEVQKNIYTASPPSRNSTTSRHSSIQAGAHDEKAWQEPSFMKSNRNDKECVKKASRQTSVVSSGSAMHVDLVARGRQAGNGETSHPSSIRSRDGQNTSNQSLARPSPVPSASNEATSRSRKRGRDPKDESSNSFIHAQGSQGAAKKRRTAASTGGPATEISTPAAEVIPVKLESVDAAANQPATKLAGFSVIFDGMPTEEGGIARWVSWDAIFEILKETGRMRHKELQKQWGNTHK